MSTIEEVPSLTLAFLAGRYIATAAAQCDNIIEADYADAGWEAAGLHAAAAAAVCVLNGREASAATADMAAAVDALGVKIRESYPRTKTHAEYPPRSEVIADIIIDADDVSGA